MPFSTDTRTLQPGDTYVAVVGETHDGHDFVPQAVEKGAAAVVVERPVEADAETIVTDDSVGWLVARASARVRELGCELVAITGSVGKTTTRGAVVAVLSESFRVRSSEGNKNTPLGLALTLLNHDLTPETVLVLEMGARLPGDIAELCRAFPPTVGVVTTVRAVHVETLGSIEGVEREKSEVVRALPADGTAVLNGDDPRTRAMTDVTKARALLFGTEPHNDVRPDDVPADLPILGAHAVYTAMSAAAVGRALGMDDAAVRRGIGSIRPEKGRLARLAGVGGSVLVDDTYNASPDATVAALDVLGGLDAERRTAILGDMLELGPTEVEQHVEVLRHALATADRVWAVDSPPTATDERRIMSRAVAALGDEVERVTLFPSAALAAKAVRAGDLDLGAGDAVLVKGSQGARMERVSEALLDPDLDPAEHLARQTPQWKAIA